MLPLHLPAQPPPPLPLPSWIVGERLEATRLLPSGGEMLILEWRRLLCMDRLEKQKKVKMPCRHLTDPKTAKRELHCHGPNIYKDTKPKRRLFLNSDQKRYLAAGVYLSEAPDPLPSPPLHTVWIHTPVLIHTGKGGRGEGKPVSRLEGRPASSPEGSKIPTWLNLQSTNSIKHQ